MITPAASRRAFRVLLDYARGIISDRFNRLAGIRRGMLFEAVEACWNDRAALSDPKENVLSLVRVTLDPVGLIECAGVDAQHVWKPLEGQANFRSAALAKMNVNPLAAAGRDQAVDRLFAGQYLIAIDRKDRLDHARRTGGALAKAAVADCYADRLSAYPIPQIAAETSAVLAHRRILSLAPAYWDQ